MKIQTAISSEFGDLNATKDGEMVGEYPSQASWGVHSPTQTETGSGSANGNENASENENHTTCRSGNALLSSDGGLTRNDEENACTCMNPQNQQRSGVSLTCNNHQSHGDHISRSSSNVADNRDHGLFHSLDLDMESDFLDALLLFRVLVRLALLWEQQFLVGPAFLSARPLGEPAFLSEQILVEHALL